MMIHAAVLKLKGMKPSKTVVIPAKHRGFSGLPLLAWPRCRSSSYHLELASRKQFKGVAFLKGMVCGGWV